MDDSKRAIDASTGFLMIAVALFIDGLQALLDFALIGLLLDSFIDLIAGAIFAVWFSHHDVPSGMGIAGTTLAEFIPGFNALPVWTGYVAYKVFTSRVQGETTES
ncbi:MAG TPA: hypothetical protein VHD38_03805 [Candidatus Paceibacterota bacterium]|jgi:hypothetical protein|nr:hypothetical protein [Candidatus Paceibacterota bacterium]